MIDGEDVGCFNATVPAVSNAVGFETQIDIPIKHALAVVTAGGPINVNAIMFLTADSDADSLLPTSLSPIVATFALVTLMLVTAFAGLAGFVFRRATAGLCQACGGQAEPTPAKPAKESVEIDRGDALDVAIDPFEDPVKRKSGV